MGKVPQTVAPPRPLATIALGATREDVLARAVSAARDICAGDAAFAAVRSGCGAYPVDIRDGLREAGWDQIHIRHGRGVGGQVLDDRWPRTCHDYLDDPTITPDYVPIMRREALRGLVAVAIEDLRSTRSDPAALIYVSTTTTGAPGGRAIREVLHAAELAAVGLARLEQPDAVRAPPPDHGLSARELEVLTLLGQGASNRQIAAHLVIAEPTVKGHLRAILRKLGCRSRLAAVAAGRARGLLD